MHRPVRDLGSEFVVEQVERLEGERFEAAVRPPLAFIAAPSLTDR